jgi:hypothetical protein
MSLTYTYVDLENLIKEIRDSDLNFAGYWSNGSTYFFGDVTLYNDTRYLALAASTASTPPVTAVRDDKWSALVMAITGSLAGTSSSDAYNLANEAYGLATYAVAIAGTAIGGGDATYAYNVALTALQTSWKGTSTAHEAADIARAALGTSWTGTSIGQESANIARTALETSWTGTALANQAYSLATYAVALAGTTSGTSVGEDGAVATAALETAWAGTAAGAAAYKIARTALDTSWTGTSTGHEAYDLARAAIDTSWTGTSIGQESLAVATAALETSWVGTYLANESYGMATYAISISGTGGSGDATYAYNVAKTALETSWVGTSAAADARSIAVSGTAGHSTISYSGTISVDMSGKTYQSVQALTGDFGVTAVGLQAPTENYIQAVTLRILPDTGSHSIFWDNFTWIVSQPTATLSANTAIIVSLTNYGTTVNDVYTVWASTV